MEHIFASSAVTIVTFVAAGATSLAERPSSVKTAL
jgi:hypothetical protein